MKSEKDTVLGVLREHLQNLINRRDALRKPIVEIEREMEHVAATIHSFERDAVITTEPLLKLSEEVPIQLSALQGLTQLQAIVEIAKCKGGIVRAQDAKSLLLRSGLMRKTKNSTNIVHSTILRSGKFERIAPGEYRLLNQIERINKQVERIQSDINPFVARQ